MKKKSKTLVLGAACLAILSCAYLLLRAYNKKAQEAELTQTSQEEILTADEASLASLSFEIDGSEVTFLQEDGAWSLEGDPDFPVDSTYLMTTLSYLKPLEAVRTLENITDASEYGMEDPQNTLTLTDTDGVQTVLAIGSTNTGTGDDYLMLNGDSSTIYTISSNLRSSLHEALYDYAESEELPYILTSQITGISLDRTDGGYELFLENAAWMVQEGETSVSAQQDTVNSALSSIAGVSYDGYLEYNCKAPENYGLENPSAVLTIFYEEDSEEESEAGTEAETVTQTQQLTFLIGDTDENGDYYVQQEGSAEVHTISYDALSPLLEKTAKDFEKEPEASSDVQ